MPLWHGKPDRQKTPADHRATAGCRGTEASSLTHGSPRIAELECPDGSRVGSAPWGSLMARLRWISACAAWLLWLAVLLGRPAFAQPSETLAEHEIRAVIAGWYEELAKAGEGYPWRLTARGFIDSTPHIDHVDNGAALLGPPIYTSLPARALKFAYDIDAMRIDATFAKVQVWERGYFYAFAAQGTYELAAGTTFILERQEKNGAWLIIAHQSNSLGIPPNKVTNPMPDLRDLYYATEGKGRDPETDASEAAKF